MQHDRTLSATIQMFLDLQIETTRQAYELPLRFMREFIASEPLLKDVQPEQLAAFVRWYEARKTVKSPASVNKVIKTVRTFFNWANNMDFIASSPARVLKKRKVEKYVRPEKAMSEDELQKLIAYCRHQIKTDTLDRRGNIINVSHYRNLALVLFLADGGGRRGGAFHLTINDIKLEKKVAVVLEKGNKTREVWLGDECAIALKEWFDKRADWLIQSEAGLRDIYVWSRYGEQLKRGPISKIIRRLCQAAGFKGRGPHSLRHRKGHQLQKTTDVVTASLVMGHSNPQITAEAYYDRDVVYAEQIARRLAVSSQEKLPPDKPIFFSDKIIPFPKKAVG